jgi:uncharacterized membrane protein YphA (DoxX/SURF4 family)
MGAVTGFWTSLAVHLCLLALCAAYIQGPLMKIFDFPSALAEMAEFGLWPPKLFAVVTICFELSASILVVGGWQRPLAALALAAYTLLASLIALRFWRLPPGKERMLQADSFCEHLGLSGAFILVAVTGL